jgi:hypothetical protein
VKATSRALLRVAKTGSTWTREAAAYRRFIGSPGYGTAYFNLAVDLELAWAIARRGTGATSLETRRVRALRARRDFDALLDLCDAHGIPLTVAAVGHLALESCTHPDPPAFRPSWVDGDWYGVDPRASLAARPDYYGADLLQGLLARPTQHELASHTFTHVDLADPETPVEVARFELTESLAALGAIYPELTTLVFPKNHPGYLELAAEAGYGIYRGEHNTPLGPDEHGLWRFPVGLWLAPIALTRGQAVQIVREAIRSRQLVSFYLHLYEFPTTRALERYLAPLFAFLARERDRGSLVIDTMQRIVSALEISHAAAAR